MKKYTIQDLANGKVALKNDGTLEELKEVLKKAFPKDITIPNGLSTYYYLALKTIWQDSLSTNLPKQSVKDFLEPEFKYGEEVEVSSGGNWYTRTYIGVNPNNPNLFVVSDKNSNASVSKWSKIRKIEQPKVLEVTLEYIATKFGVSVEEIKIKK